MYVHTYMSAILAVWMWEEAAMILMTHVSEVTALDLYRHIFQFEGILSVIVIPGSSFLPHAVWVALN